MFLELNKKASNHATRAEVGKYPLQITIINLIFKYYIYLKDKDDSSIVKLALIISQDLGLKIFNSYHSKLLELLKFCNSRHLRQPHKLRHEHLSEMISFVKNKYSDFWKQKIETSPKLDFYKKIKKDFSSEMYLEMAQNNIICKISN